MLLAAEEETTTVLQDVTFAAFSGAIEGAQTQLCFYTIVMIQ